MYNAPAIDYSRCIAVTNRHLCAGDYLEQIRKIADLHPGGLILREKDLNAKEYERLARQVLAICRERQVPCFLHSHADIARKLRCERIHLPLGGLLALTENADESAPAAPVSTADASASPLTSFSHISVSCHSAADVQAAVSHGATQIVLGNIFETNCKKGLPGKGLDFLREICARSPIPVYAIGGIGPENFSSVCDAGAAGGCMMSGFMQM